MERKEMVKNVRSTLL